MNTVLTTLYCYEPYDLLFSDINNTSIPSESFSLVCRINSVRVCECAFHLTVELEGEKMKI